MRNRQKLVNTLLAFALGAPLTMLAQAPADSTQRGTVKAVSGGTVTIATDANLPLVVTPGDGATLVQLPPGATNLKTATPIQLVDIQAGDRVLVKGHPGDGPGTVVAARIILMKATALADLHADQAADWQRNGTGGLVKAVAVPDLTVALGTRTFTVETTPATIYRRYAGDSVKFEDAKPGTLTEIHAGDQLRVRGAKSADGATVTAVEIVSGSFQNLAGVISAVDPTAGTVTLKDLATKKTVTVHVTANSDLRNLPAQAAAAYARSHAAGASAGGGSSPAAAQPAGASGQGGQGGQPRRSFDLSQMITRLPAEALTDLKSGQAVLIVASQSGTGQLTAVTMLSGVEPILTATPSGAAPTLSPWSLGGGAGAEAEGGGGPGL